MRNAASALAIAVVLAAQGCIHVDVVTEAESGFDFTRFGTFAHAPEDPAEAAQPDAGRVHSITRQQIEQALEAKGYRAAPLESADMVVAFRTSGVSKMRVQNAGDPDSDFYTVRNYVEGTLVIDIFDPAESSPVWHGVGRTDIYGERDAERAAKRAVEAILAEFPPAAGA